MKPHESPRINKKSIRGDSRDSWPVWNRGIICFVALLLSHEKYTYLYTTVSTMSFHYASILNVVRDPLKR